MSIDFLYNKVNIIFVEESPLIALNHSKAKHDIFLRLNYFTIYGDQ